jgi:tape measure domain-containing protein
MASRRSSIGAQLHLDKRGFKAALDSAKNDAQAWKSGVEAMKLKRGALTGEGVGIGKWTELNSKIQVVGGGVKSLGGAALSMGRSLATAELSFENLLRGLASTGDGSESLRAELEALKEVAKMPGLGFREAIQGATALKGAKLSAAEAREALVAFGNALTNAGKGKTELNDVLLSIQSMISTNQVDMENLKEIATRIPGFLEMAARVPKGNAMEWVRGIIKELQKLPKAAESGQDAIDNIQDSIDQEKLGLSGGSIAGGAQQLLQLGGAVMEADLLKIRKSWDSIADAPELIEKYQPTEAELARRKKLREELAAAEKEQKEAAERAAARAKEEEAKAKQTATQPLRDAAQQDLDVLRLRAAGRNKQADKLEQQQGIEKRRKELQDAGMGFYQAEAIANEESSLRQSMAKGRRVTYKGESSAGFRGLAANRELADKNDRSALNEEWSFPGLDGYKAMQGKNSLKSQAEARAAGKANAAAADPVSKAVTFFGPEIVKKLDLIAAALTPLAPLPAAKLP